MFKDNDISIIWWNKGQIEGQKCVRQQVFNVWQWVEATCVIKSRNLMVWRHLQRLKDPLFSHAALCGVESLFRSSKICRPLGKLVSLSQSEKVLELGAVGKNVRLDPTQSVNSKCRVTVTDRTVVRGKPLFAASLQFTEVKLRQWPCWNSTRVAFCNLARTQCWSKLGHHAEALGWFQLHSCGVTTLSNSKGSDQCQQMND